MKLLLATILFCVSLSNASPSFINSVSVKEKNEKNDKKKEGEDKASQNKNLHSVNKWKVTIEYINGSIISKTIVVNEDSELSALETAFKEADKHLKNKRKVKNYSVSPVSNSYVLLAGD